MRLICYRIVTLALFLLQWGILQSEIAEAAPRGAVRLLSPDIFQSGTFSCGLIRGSFIPGRSLTGNFFYSRVAERKNLRRRAGSLPAGAAKRAVQRKIRSLTLKIASEGPICTAGRPADSTPTPTPTPSPAIVLQTISDRLFYTEHAIFIIPEPGQVTFEGNGSWDSVYATANISSYLNTLKSTFPGDYFMAVITASDLLPDRVPNVLTNRQIASGIGQDTLIDPTATNICRYHSSGPVGNGIFGVLDHEVGHNWGVFIGTEVAEGHWHSNSTVTGLMANVNSDDGFETVKQISGTPGSGFRWTSVDNGVKNEEETFADQDLYLQGLAATFPTVHVLNSPVYNNDGTVSYSGVNSYDQAWVEARNGVRNPDYRSSEKSFHLGFIYVARDMAEVLAAYQPLERSIRQFIYAEEIDRIGYRFQVPFLVATKFRGSMTARLANLDGNAAPTLSIGSGGYVSTTTGSASIPFSAADPDGAVPVVSCVPASGNCAISGSTVVLSGLTVGAHFFTIKAEDTGGKKVFAHIVVDAS